MRRVCLVSLVPLQLKSCWTRAQSRKLVSAPTPSSSSRCLPSHNFLFSSASSMSQLGGEDPPAGRGLREGYFPRSVHARELRRGIHHSAPSAACDLAGHLLCSAVSLSRPRLLRARAAGRAFLGLPCISMLLCHTSAFGVPPRPVPSFSFLFKTVPEKIDPVSSNGVSVLRRSDFRLQVLRHLDVREHVRNDTPFPPFPPPLIFSDFFRQEVASPSRQ